jgi:hypothetical protein
MFDYLGMGIDFLVRQIRAMLAEHQILVIARVLFIAAPLAPR